MWYLILGIIAAIYLFINVYLVGGGVFEVYVLRPMLWLILAIITFIIAYSEGLNILKFKKIRKWTMGKTPIHAGLLLGGFQVALLIIVGVLFGFLYTRLLACWPTKSDAPGSQVMSRPVSSPATNPPP